MDGLGHGFRLAQVERYELDVRFVALGQGSDPGEVAAADPAFGVAVRRDDPTGCLLASEQLEEDTAQVAQANEHEGGFHLRIIPARLSVSDSDLSCSFETGRVKRVEVGRDPTCDPGPGVSVFPVMRNCGSDH